MKRALIAVISVFAAVVFAATAFGAQKPSFDQADKNNNGKVSIQEAVKAGAEKDNAKLNDLDDDGKLTKKDWKYVKMKQEDKKKESTEPEKG
ncbi:MAG: hypothetical protein K9K82_11440 [Desulfobacteraceae bacterium]|nr:hypothetical protein [Desulfobacteraceae bacterium]